MLDPYTILNITPQATKQEIKTAYRKAMLKVHPDLNENTIKNQKKLLLIQKAYYLLKDQNITSYIEHLFQPYDYTPPENIDYDENITLSFKESVIGTERVIRIGAYSASVTIPPGTEHHSLIDLQNGLKNREGKTQKCIIYVSLLNDPLWRYKDSHLYHICKLTPEELKNGTEYNITLPNEQNLIVTIPKNSLENTIITCQKQGIRLKRQKRGDLILILKNKNAT